MVLLILAALAGQVTVDVRAGFSGSAFADSWGRVEVLVDNQGTLFEGELSVTLGGPGLVPRRFLRPVSIPAPTRRRIPFDFYLGGAESQVEVELRDARGRARSRVSKPLRVRGSAEFRVLVVVAGPAGFSPTPMERVTLVRIPPEQFPPDARPLEALDAIFFPHAVELEPAGELALREWVRNGGILLFGPSPAGALPAGLWREWGPLENPRPANVIWKREGMAPLEGLAWTGTIRPGTMFHPLQDEWGVYVRPRDFGHLSFVNFDPVSAIGKEMFPEASWDRFLLPHPPEEDPGEEILESSDRFNWHTARVTLFPEVEGRLFENMGFWAIQSGLFFACLIVLGPLAALASWRRGRRKAAWVLAIGVAGFGSIGLARADAGPWSGQGRKVVLVEAGRVRTFLEYRSPKGRRVEMRGDAIASFPTVLRFGAPEPAPDEARDGSVAFELHARSMRAVAATETSDAASLLRVRWSDDGRQSIEIVNRTPWDLVEAWVFRLENSIRLGRIPKGSSAIRKLSDGEPEAWEKMGRQWSLAPRERTDFGLVAPRIAAFQLSEPNLHTRFWDDGPDLLAPRGLDRSDWIRRGNTLFVARLEVDPSGVRIDPPGELEFSAAIRVPVEEPE